MGEEVKDITIIGAGPSGLFTAFQAGMHEASVRIIDSMSEPGGQLTALYPEKYIFDAPGFSKVTAKDFADNLFAQANQFTPELRFNETVVDIKISPLNPPISPLNKGGVRGIEGEGNLFDVVTDKGRYRSKTVIIAAGLGAFQPRTLAIPEMAKFEGKGIHYIVREKGFFKGKDVVIAGGGDSALDWAMNLLDTARDISLVHRRDAFRAHPNTIQQVSANAAQGRIRVFTSCEVKGVHGSGKLEEVAVVDAAGKEVVLRADALLLMLGFTSDLGPIEKWGLDIEDSRIRVNTGMETNRKGVFAIGDIANYPGKLKLILTGFSEGALAVRSAIPYIRPGDKFRHAYSTSLKIFSKMK